MREFPKDTTLSPNGKVADFTSLLALRNEYEPMVGELSGASVPAYNEYGQVSVDSSLDNFLSNLDFGTFEQQTNNYPLPGENMILWSEQETIYLDRAVLNQRAFDIREKLKYAAVTINPPHTPSKEIIDAIEHITANKIAYWIKLYFRHWHKHGPMVHEPTFNPCTAALPLVLALMSLGGMVSFPPASATMPC
jgi:hypothetical protein